MTAPPPVPKGGKAKITLTGAAATLLFTLAGRLDDLRQPNPILQDKWAGYVAEQIDYDYSTIGVSPTSRDILCLRTAGFDRWTREFLEAHESEQVTVLHLACGLDARAHRVRWGPNVRWIDVDQPDVVKARRELLPAPEGDYALVSGSVLDEEFLASVPNDRPTVVVAEGLTMYFEEGQVRDLVRRLCARFGSGELLFDVLSPAMVGLQKWTNWLSSGAWMRKQGTGFVSGLGDPAALEEVHPGLKLRSSVPWTELELENPTTGHKVLRFLAQLPLPRLDGFNLRYTF